MNYLKNTLSKMQAMAGKTNWNMGVLSTFKEVRLQGRALFSVIKAPYLLILLIGIGCKKNVEQDAAAIKKPDQTVMRSVAGILFSSQPDWANKISQRSPSNKNIIRTIVPLFKSSNAKFYKYVLVEQEMKEGSVEIGRLLSRTVIDKNTDLYNLPLGKDGTVKYYDKFAPDGGRSKLLLKEKGTKLTSAAVKPADLQSSELTPSFPVPISCEVEGGFCIDHWWVTYNDDGEILTIDYIGSDCYQFCLTGEGGPGTGTPANEASCNALIDDIVGQTAVGDLPASILYGVQQGETREVIYRWTCLINYGGWKLVSTEKGVHKKVTNKLNPWEWVSLTHLKVDLQGTVMGGSVEHNEIPVTTVGIYNAGIQLLIHIDYKVACTPIVTRYGNYQSRYIFNINDPGITPV